MHLWCTVHRCIRCTTVLALPSRRPEIMTQPIISTARWPALLFSLRPSPLPTPRSRSAHLRQFGKVRVLLQIYHIRCPPRVCRSKCARAHMNTCTYVPQLAHMSAHVSVTAPTALRMASPVLECAHQSGSVLATPVTSFLIWPLMLRDACGRNAAPAHTEDVCHNHAQPQLPFIRACTAKLMTTVTPLQSPAIHSAKPRVRHCARRDHHGAVLV
jgi:hypothetical protein